MPDPVKVPFRSARLFLTLRNMGSNSDEIFGEAICGDLRITVDVPWENWPEDEVAGGPAEFAEVELT